MKFFLKVFIAMFSFTAMILIALEISIFRFVTFQSESEYILRYENFSNQIRDTLVQIDKLSDSILLNAAYVLRETEKENGLPSNEALMNLKNKLGVRSLSITDQRGNFLRSDWLIAIKNDPQLQAHYKGKNALSKSLFTYCKDYKNLITGQSLIEKTPVIPSGSGGFPGKFLMIPNYNRTRILEVNMLMSSIGEILDNAMRPDASIVSIGLFAPNGEVLGYVPPNSENSTLVSHLEEGAMSFSQPQRSKTSFIFFSKVPTTMKDCCECKTKGVTASDGSYYYILRMEVSRSVLNNQLMYVRWWFLFIGFLAIASSAIIAHFISRHLVRKLIWMSERVKKIAESNDLNLRLQIVGRDEIATLAQRFDDMMEQLKLSRLQLAATEKEKALGMLARQVAHDIRSPLAALEIVSNDVSFLPELPRTIIRSAVSRVRDIANNLLDKHREVATDVIRDKCSVCLLSGLVDPLMTEKRMQFRSKINIEIEARLDAASYGLFISVQPTEFKRVLSNLVNNAVEALCEKGLVMVHLANVNGQVIIEVRDNGKGVAPEFLAKLGQQGETYGKFGGLGLGLYHAKTSIESWGGNLEIFSTIGKGTTVVIKLPRAQNPEWFVSNLQLASGCVVVALDDDTNIHQVWQSRFDSLQAKNSDIELLHFVTPEEFRYWVRENASKERNVFYLIDYELLGYKETGLSLIEELNIGECSILVTSRFEEKNILEHCLRLKVRLIPKGLAGFVPISMGCDN